MGKATKWIRLIFTGKRDREKSGTHSSPLPAETRSGPISMPAEAPREKSRWSFRRSATGTEMEHKSAQAAAAAVMIRLTATATSAVEGAAATRIQAAFRSYLARRALCALRGLVKLQAMVRGHLVRRQATVVLRSMQALVTAQARARTQRIRMLEDGRGNTDKRRHNHRRSAPHELRSQQSYEMEENAKVVEMDIGEFGGNLKNRSSYPIFVQPERRDHRLSTKGNHYTDLSPARSALTDRSPGASTSRGYLGEFSFATLQSSPTKSYASVSQDCPLFPNYMANTESSRAKARSESAPKQRPEPCERPSSQRRPSVDGRRATSAARMLRSSAHMNSIDKHQYPWSVKLGRSSVSLQESECGSTSTALTNTNYCQSLMAYEVRNIDF